MQTTPVQSPTMQQRPLLISSLIDFAAKNHADTEIVSRSVEGPIHRYTYAGASVRAKRAANALSSLGIAPGARVGTLAWNTFRHFELYYGVSGMGAILHTINPRLFPEQIVWIANHAEDEVLCFDINLAPLVDKVASQLTSVKHFVAMTDRAHMPTMSTPNVLCYEDLLATASPHFDWPQFDPYTPSSLCYTSGTTGNPKGVLYTHFSTLAHTTGAATPDALNIGALSVVMPVVPMFHVNAWGTPYVAASTGAKLVLPGPKLDGASLHELMDAEGVTVSLGVPTIWMMLLAHMQSSGATFKTLKETVIGGSACPPAMIDTFATKYGVDVIHAWGMTELSPLGTACRLKPKHLGLSAAEKVAVRAKQGKPIFGVEMKIVGDDGAALPHDGKAFGDLLVRGPWIVERYFKEEKSALVDGWFPTGDVATIDPDGYLQITDRSKDVIKSGGEWISSIELENIAIAHPAVAEAAVIGVAHPKWDERPLLILVLKAGTAVTREEMLAFYEGKIAKWMIPDDVTFVSELPHTATGKLLKTKLRADFKGYALPTA